MPCNSDYPRENLEEKRLREELDKVTRYLCAVLTDLEDEVQDGNNEIDPRAFLQSLSPDLRIWWKKHKKWDAKRRAQEAEEKRKKELRKAALAKLTDEERVLLGLKHKLED
jgi:hypothetical protein